MSKPAAYTLQLQKKANGVLQMRLMLPGREVIVMSPRALNEVASAVRVMFDQIPSATSMSEACYVAAIHNGSASPSNEVQALKDRVAMLERRLMYGGAALSSLQAGLNNYSSVTGGVTKPI